LVLLLSFLSNAYRRLYGRFVRNAGIHLTNSMASHHRRHVDTTVRTSNLTYPGFVFYGFPPTLQENSRLLAYRQEDQTDCSQILSLRDFSLPPRCKWDLRSSVM
jgi:hypothetical protein